MFDHTACAGQAMLSTSPFVDMAALSALGELLADLLKARPASSKVPLSGASCASREQNRGEAHVREDSSCRTAARQSRTKYGRRRKPEQMDLFGSGRSSVVIGAPAWPELPAETQRALIRLMARLLLEHADKSQAAAMTGADHDL
jgi:hypothetical protein